MTISRSKQLPNKAAIIYLERQEQLHFEKGSPGYLAAQGLNGNDFRPFWEQDGRPAFVVLLKEDADYEQALDTARLLAHRHHSQWPADILIDSYLPGPEDARLAAVVEGLALGRYRIGKWKKEAAELMPEPTFFIRQHGESLAEWIKANRPAEVQTNNSSFSLETEEEPPDPELDAERIYHRLDQRLILADVEIKIMDLVNAPPNHKRPQQLAAWAEASARTYGFDVDVHDKSGCEKLGLHALLAVNRGSEDGAHLIVLEYKGKGAGDEGPAVLVGKGVTFDTGGVSIKSSKNMHLMKSDMGGAAAVLGTLEAAARLKLGIHLVGIIPATDNSVDALSIKPGDVISSYSGKTIEVIDTDAEGRLIMADGLAYALRHFEPSRLLTIATLTGSAVRTFGYACAALFSKNEDVVDQLQQAGDRAGQRVWPLPTWDVYRSDLHSDVADIANLGPRPIAGAIDAFKFLEFFTDQHPAYVHLDIAGVALKAGPYAKDRQATAYGPRLLLEWLA